MRFTCILCIVPAACCFIQCADAGDHSSAAEKDTVVASPPSFDTTLSASDTLRYVLPQPLQYDDYLVDKEVIPENYLVAPVYPIGWSKTGAFAWVTQKATEGNTFEYIFRIRQTDNDSSLLSYRFSVTQNDSNASEAWRKTWKMHEQLFTSQLNRHHIVQQLIFKIDYFLPGRHDIAVSPINVKTADSDSARGAYIASETFSMSTKLGKKDIASFRYGDRSTIISMTSFILRSPYSDDHVALSHLLYRYGKAYIYLVECDFIGVNTAEGFH